MRQPTDQEVTALINIENRFATLAVDEADLAAMVKVRAAFQELSSTIARATKVTREQSLAFTALEEAKYWANQSIAVHGRSDIDWGIIP